MRPALATLGLAAAVAWWLPTLAGYALAATPHLAAALGTPYRAARARSLIARGDLDEARRVLAAMRREQTAAERWADAIRLRGR